MRRVDIRWGSTLRGEIRIPAGAALGVYRANLGEIFRVPDRGMPRVWAGIFSGSTNAAAVDPVVVLNSCSAEILLGAGATTLRFNFNLAQPGPGGVGFIVGDTPTFPALPASALVASIAWSVEVVGAVIGPTRVLSLDMTALVAPITPYDDTETRDDR